jgi:hypothetical protein
MKKFALLLCIAAAVSLAAQTKPSAGTPRREAPAATAAAENPAPEAAAAAAFALPPGTAVYMKLETPISTRTNSRGDRFSGRVTQPVNLNGRTVIPVGAAIEGRVLQADEPRRIRGVPTIDLHPETVTMPDGTRFAMNAVVVDTSLHPDVEVNEEGRIRGKGRDGRDWKETGIATGAGAGIGALAGGGKGALLGAGIGATASVVRWMTRTHSASLPVNTEIIMELSRPMSLSSTSAGQ